MTVEKTRVERIPVQTQPTPVSDELGRLQAALAELCPKDSTISFEYDGKLHLHVDLRGFEDVNRMEAILPTLFGGIFHDVRRTLAGPHSFFHRVTALVNR